MISQEQYERNEANRFYAALQGVQDAPIADRRAAQKAFREAMASDPELIAERVGWLLAGNYGYGSYKEALRAVQSPRLDKVEWLLTRTAALEWRCPIGMALEAYRTLTKTQKAVLVKLVEREIDLGSVE